LLYHFPKSPDSIGAQSTPLLHSRFQDQDYVAAATSRKGNDEQQLVWKGEGKRNNNKAARSKKERRQYSKNLDLD
jgi:hypothetical protein